MERFEALHRVQTLNPTLKPDPIEMSIWSLQKPFDIKVGPTDGIEGSNHCHVPN